MPAYGSTPAVAQATSAGWSRMRSPERVRRAGRRRPRSDQGRRATPSRSSSASPRHYRTTYPASRPRSGRCRRPRSRRRCREPLHHPRQLLPQALRLELCHSSKLGRSRTANPARKSPRYNAAATVRSTRHPSHDDPASCPWGLQADSAATSVTSNHGQARGWRATLERSAVSVSHRWRPSAPTWSGTARLRRTLFRPQQGAESIVAVRVPRDGETGQQCGRLARVEGDRLLAMLDAGHAEQRNAERAHMHRTHKPPSSCRRREAP